MEKVVLDLNTIISGSLFRGNEAEILSLLRSKRFQAVISKKMIVRLSAALNYPRLAKHLHGKTKAYILENALKDFEIVDDVEEGIPFELDVDDSAVLLCAVSQKVEYLVTGDNKLLEIKNYEGVDIVTSTKLLQICNNVPAAMEKFRGRGKGLPPFVRDKSNRIFD